MRNNLELEAKAKELCIEAHKGQKRKWSGAPYSTHPIAVAEKMMTVEGATSEMVAACYLHDVIEDCDITYQQLKAMFGTTVAVLVLEVTTPVMDAPRHVRKMKEHARLAGVSYEAKKIKMCDRLHNLSDMDRSNKDWLKKCARETVGLIEAVGDADEKLKAELDEAVKGLNNGAQGND